MKMILSSVIIGALINCSHAMDIVEFFKTKYGHTISVTSTNLVSTSQGGREIIVTLDNETKFEATHLLLIYTPVVFRDQRKGFKVADYNLENSLTNIWYVGLGDTLSEMEEGDVVMFMVDGEWKTPKEYDIIQRQNALRKKVLYEFAEAMAEKNWETSEEKNAIERRVLQTLIRAHRAEIEALGMWEQAKRTLDDDPTPPATPPEAEPEPPPVITSETKQSSAEEGRAVSPQPPSRLWLYVVVGVLLCAVLGLSIKKTRKAG